MEGRGGGRWLLRILVEAKEKPKSGEARRVPEKLVVEEMETSRDAKMEWPRMRRVSAARKAEEGCGRTGMVVLVVVEAAQLKERRRQSMGREKVESEKWK